MPGDAHRETRHRIAHGVVFLACSVFLKEVWGSFFKTEKKLRVRLGAKYFCCFLGILGFLRKTLVLNTLKCLAQKIRLRLEVMFL